jgi:hypothetical protein
MTGGVAQVVVHLASKYKTLNSIPNTAKKKKKPREIENGG